MTPQWIWAVIITAYLTLRQQTKPNADWVSLALSSLIEEPSLNSDFIILIARHSYPQACEVPLLTFSNDDIIRFVLDIMPSALHAVLNT